MCIQIISPRVETEMSTHTYVRTHHTGHEHAQSIESHGFPNELES